MKKSLKQKITKTTKQVRKPLWDGPKDDGITNSLLKDFLNCRERFRIKIVEGLGVRESFKPSLHYGQYWHEAEETYSKTQEVAAAINSIYSLRDTYYQEFPYDQDVIHHWAEICALQFPVYLQFWDKYDKPKKTQETLFEERSFKVPYFLPSGEEVSLRGKFDRVDSYKSRGKNYLILQENKTKGQIEEGSIENQLAFDLQTGIYLTALNELCKKGEELEGYHIKLIRYNVVRKPLSGGKHSIRPHKATSKKPAETYPEFYDRLQGLIAEEPDHYFKRWEVEFTLKDLDNFKSRCLNPILAQLLNWWDALNSPDVDIFDPFSSFIPEHYQHPYGVFNPIDAGMFNSVDEYIQTGNSLNLKKLDTLFPELS